jgi:uncharacterized protein (DUF488 family)
MSVGTQGDDASGNGKPLLGGGGVTSSTVIRRRTGRSAVTPAPLCTIGYAGKTLQGFISLLQNAGVRRVVDVRELPLSRRKGFSKTPLKEALATAGIEYLHLRVAGNPFREQKADIETCLRLYAGHVDGHPEVMREVETAISGARAALLCFEESACDCHRSILVERLLATSPDLKIRHL